MVNEKLKSANYEIKDVVNEKTDNIINETVGIVSAGGRGVRLRPHTLEKPKPLLEVGSYKEAMMYWSIYPMILGGISKFIIGVRYDADKVTEKFGNGKEISERLKKEINIDYVEEPKPLGRAGFIKHGIEEGKINPEKPALLFNASDILKLNLKELVRHYLWLNTFHNCEIVQVYTSAFRTRYGIGKVDIYESKVTNFYEKPLIQEFANTACYFIHQRMNDFRKINKVPSNIEDELVHKWINEGILGSYIIPQENMISIKDNKDFEQTQNMNLSEYIESVYE